MMKLLCIGDIAISKDDRLEGGWEPPIQLQQDTRILFNCELPIGFKVNPVERSSGPRLIAHPGTASILQAWAPGFAALANNHILDAGEPGLVNTIDQVQKAGLVTFGAGADQAEICKPIFWETQEGTLAMVNWVFPETHPDWRCIPGPNCWPGMDEAKNIIRGLKPQADWVMVQAHWSDELFPYPRPEDRDIAQELVEAGVDMWISHHPHVVRGMEQIGCCPVFYSLGNFYFSDFPATPTGILERQAPRNRESLGVLVSFQKGKAPEVQILSFWQEKGRVIRDPSNRAARRLEAVSRSLRQFHGSDYQRWRSDQYARFVRYGYLWQFRLFQLGLPGIFQTLWRKFFNSLPDKSSGLRNS